MHASSTVIEDITDQYEQDAQESGFATPPASMHSEDYHSLESGTDGETDHEQGSTTAARTSPAQAGSEVAEANSAVEAPSAGNLHSAASQIEHAEEVTTPPDPLQGAAEASGSLAQLTDEERLQQAEALKQEGNQLYIQGDLQEALGRYRQAAEAAPESAAVQRAIYHCNEAAVQLKLQAWTDAAKAASRAIELDDKYVKGYSRRATAYQELDDLEHALADYQKVAELSNSPQVLQEVKRLTPIVEERREKLKEEMMGKLKDLGNTVLGKFGMSLDNFKAVQDPSTGSYSINFQQ